MSSGPALSRKEIHEKGVIALREGNYRESIELFETALVAHGPHVGLLSDLAGATYLNGEMALFELHTERLVHEFRQARPFLSARSRVLTLVSLAKYFEELARWAEAFDSLAEAESELQVGDPLLLRIQMQKLRLLADVGRRSEIIRSYDLCLGISARQPQLSIEASHALALAEMRLFGFERAWQRVLDLSSREGLQHADLSLLLMDLLEVAVESENEKAQQQILDWMRERGVEGRDEFEVAILSLARDFPDYNRDLQKLGRFSPMGRLRWLALVAKGKTSDSDHRRQFILRVQGADHRTRALFTHKWASHFKAQDKYELRIHSQIRRLAHKDNEICLGKSPQSWRILEILADQGGEATPLSVLEDLERHEANAVDLETLRIALLRLNQKLSSFLSIEWVIKFRKDQILLHPSVFLTKVKS